MTLFGVIGPGNLGEALLKKLSQHQRPFFYHPRLDRCRDLESRELGLSKELHEMMECDIIFLTIKPNQAKEVCAMIRSCLRGKSPIFISAMAGVPVDFLCSELGTPQVARIMLDLSVGQLYLNRQIFIYSPKNLQEKIVDISPYIGRFVWFDDEVKLDTATAIFGCGPAFIARIYQAYLEIAQQAGFSSEYVLDLFDATLYMLNNGHSSQEIMAKVASKGGATERGLQHLNVVDGALAECIGVAEKRCHELREELQAKIDK